MRSSGLLALAALAALVAVGMTGAGFGVVPPAATTPAPKRPASPAPVSDPAEPPLTVEASSGGSGATVAGSARGTAVKFNTTGAWQGQAGLTFKSGAPPMRFTLTLAKMPN